MCDYCRPLEPYDLRYLEENKIKHLSFHSYLRQLMSQNKTSANRGFVPPLEMPDFKLKKNCPTGHPPYPEGICTKCQPSAYTLQQQEFRMVDHLEFESSAIMESLLSFWRSTGYQRFGFMYGRYEEYPEVPLGVKAVVTAIYEPPQEGAVDGIQLVLPDPHEKDVEEAAANCGLRRLGMIYTDLEDDGSGKGTVVCKRHADSFFLSSGEVVFSAGMQLQHPTSSKYASEGTFGSRFITAVVTGNTEKEIDIFPYQVSNAGMAMVRDNVVEASTDPSVMLVKAASREQYVPELFYKFRNEYGVVVKMPAKPAFPVEYLLVTVRLGLQFSRALSTDMTAPTAYARLPANAKSDIYLSYSVSGREQGRFANAGSRSGQETLGFISAVPGGLGFSFSHLHGDPGHFEQGNFGDILIARPLMHFVLPRTTCRQ